MLTRKKISENTNAQSRAMGPKKMVTEGPIKIEQAKLKKPVLGGQTRRAAFGDITNAASEPILQDKKKLSGPVKPIAKANVNAVCNKPTRPIVLKKKSEVKKKAGVLNKASVPFVSTSNNSIQSSLKPSVPIKEQVPKTLPEDVPVVRVEEEISFVTIEDEQITATDQSECVADKDESILSVDLENYTDVFNVGIYAQHIFDYYKCREKMFRIPAYLNRSHGQVTPSMRAILVDWMVEVQENFELNHETLYLAVKLADLYLSRVAIDKEELQLVGAVAIFIASKFDERCPPLIDDFTYICDNAFERDQFISMEMKILKTVDFDLGIPISYTFLRRYAKVARLSIETLTLARFILEMSLMEYDLVVARDSMLAAAALYIAQQMRKEGNWEGDVIKSSGYRVEDIKNLIMALNKMLHARPIPQLPTIRSKYSHQIFHGVANIAPLPTEELLRL